MTTSFESRLEYVANMRNKKDTAFVKFALTFNNWLCQVIIEDVFIGEYYANPPGGIVDDKSDNRYDAMVKAVDRAINEYEAD